MNLSRTTRIFFFAFQITLHHSIFRLSTILLRFSQKFFSDSWLRVQTNATNQYPKFLTSGYSNHLTSIALRMIMIFLYDIPELA